MDVLLDYKVAVLVMDYDARIVDACDWNTRVGLFAVKPAVVLVRMDELSEWCAFYPTDDPEHSADLLSRLKELGFNVEILIPASGGAAVVRLNGPGSKAVRAKASSHMVALCMAAIEAVQ